MTTSPNVCIDNYHAYPQVYAGDPQYAEQFFSLCLCGKMRRVTTVQEVEVKPSGSKKEKKPRWGVDKKWGIDE